MTTEATVVFVTVVALRFLVPLLIPKFPLPAILACLVIDGIDQTIFQTFGFDPPGYQNYDKAMDVYYLAIAFLSSMQNWTHSGAVRISRFLFFYRMIGVMAFELIEPIFRKYGGRPHWGKLHSLGAADLAKLYPKWQDVQAIRQQLDPQGKLLNPFLRRIWGA